MDQMTVESLALEETMLLGARRLAGGYEDPQLDVQAARVGLLDEAKPKLGSGKRFAALVKDLKARGDVDDPNALAAWIGRKKYGAAKFNKLSHHEDAGLDPLTLAALSETGERFAKLKAKLARRGDVRDPGAVAAVIGRKKYGKAKFAKMAHHEGFDLMTVVMMESGERFKKLSAKLARRGDVQDPDAVAAAIGRKKYGKAKFAKMAHHEAFGDLLTLIVLEDLVVHDWAKQFASTLKSLLEKNGELGDDFEVKQAGNVGAYVSGTFNGEKFTIELRSKARYERSGSPRFVNAMKVNGNWLPGGSAKKAAAALGESILDEDDEENEVSVN